MVTKEIRSGLGLIQNACDKEFRFSLEAVREWGQGRRRPEMASWMLLWPISRNLQVITEALEASTVA